MTKVKRIVLDVLKPHTPNGLEFSQMLADKCTGLWISFKVIEVDEKTETVVLEIEADSIEYECISNAITSMGGTIHSIDEVEVTSSADSSNA